MTQRRKPGEERFPPLPDEVPVETRRRRRARKVADPAQKSRDRLYNLLAVVFAVGTVLGILSFIYLWNNYNSPINPLAPPTPMPNIVTATYTPTLTYTPSPTLTPSLTYTPSPIPTFTPSLTFTPVFLEGFSTPDGTPVAPGLPGSAEGADFTYELQFNRVLYLTNPDGRGACRWSSIAGSAMDFDGNAVNGYQVHIVGEGVDETVTTGSAPGFGPGGFEVPLGSVARDDTFVAQLLDDAGQPASPVYTVVTRSDCTQTIAALRFVELAP